MLKASAIATAAYCFNERGVKKVQKTGKSVMEFWLFNEVLKNLIFSNEKSWLYNTNIEQILNVGP